MASINQDEARGDIAPSPYSGPRLYDLGDAFALLVLDDCSEAKEQTDTEQSGALLPCAPRVSRAGGTRPNACTAVRLNLTAHGPGSPAHRHVVFMHFAAGVHLESTELNVEFRGAGLVVVTDEVNDVKVVAADLDVAARQQLVRGLLGFCGGLGKPIVAPAIQTLVCLLLELPVTGGTRIDCIAGVGDDSVVVAAGLDPADGPAQFVALMGAHGIVVGKPGAARAYSSWVAMDGRLLRGAGTLIVACRNNVVVRELDGGLVRTVDLLAWMRTHADDQGRELDALLTALEPLARSQARVHELCLELQVRFPRRGVAALQAQAPVAAELTLGVVDDGGGVFLSGWIHDPHSMAASMTVHTPLGPSQAVDFSKGQFPSRAAGKRCEELDRRPLGSEFGFVAYAQGIRSQLRCLQPRVELHLSSGSRLQLVPALKRGQLANPAVAKAAILGCVPDQFVSDSIMHECIAPCVARLHAEHMCRERVRATYEFGHGPRAPAVSVVIPLYRNVDYLKTQLAALAIGSNRDECEIVLVLDSPEMQHALVHLLEGLSGCYNLPMRLVVMNENFGYAAACNAGAEAALGEKLLMLNSDVLPVRDDWLHALRKSFSLAPRAGAVGAKLLFDDGSLQHAGLYFAPDAKGRWLNRHFYKGYPGAYPSANVACEVPAVTGACVLLSAVSFREIGGFTEDYVYGDYEDSDLCLKLRRAGYTIHYEPRATLYHIERKSVTLHSGYMRGVAWQYNCALHQRRWLDDMRPLMRRFATSDAAAVRPGRSQPTSQTPRAVSTANTGVDAA